MSKVDVLAVMDRISGRMFDTPDLRAIADCGELRRVRAIIAELIDAAQSLRTIYAVHADRSSPAHTVLAPSIDRLNSAIEQVKPCGGDAVAWIIPASLERLAEGYSATVYGKLAIEVHKQTADVATIPLFTSPNGAVQCIWTYDEDSYAWDSSCGAKYSFMEGGPEDNGHKFCHSCGKKLALKETP